MVIVAADVVGSAVGLELPQPQYLPLHTTLPFDSTPERTHSMLPEGKVDGSSVDPQAQPGRTRPAS